MYDKGVSLTDSHKFNHLLVSVGRLYFYLNYGSISFDAFQVNKLLIFLFHVTD